MVRDTSLSSRLFDVVIHLTLLVVLVASLYPLLHVASASVSQGSAFDKNIITFYPQGLQLEVYKTIFERPTIPRGFKNSLIYTGVGTFVSLALTIAMAYPLSKKRLGLRKLYTVLIIITMFFSGGLIPTYLVVRGLGLLNSLWAIVLPGAITTWNLIVLRSFFQALPVELEESAYLDGAHDITILLRIVIPLSQAAIATIGLFYMVAHWNSWFPAAIYLRSHAKYPLQLLLREIVILGELVDQLMDEGRTAEVMMIETISREGMGRYISLEQLKYGVLFVSLVPLLMIYPFIQRYFVKGVMIGSLKG